MEKLVEIHYFNIKEVKEYNDLIQYVMTKAFKEEKMEELKLYVNVILTNPEEIKKLNQQYRNNPTETDVLSFPMFEKQEIQTMLEKGNTIEEVLGDIVISIPRVAEQAQEYGHSFQRELAYMLIHGFYHLLGYDHMQEEEKKQMRTKEEWILQQLNIIR